MSNERDIQKGARQRRDELNQLRDDLDTLERTGKMLLDTHQKTISCVKARIAELESEAADRWQDVKKFIRGEGGVSIDSEQLAEFFDHLTAENERLQHNAEQLTAENARLEKRVAELEAAASDVTALLETTDEASDPSADAYVAVATANAVLAADMQPPKVVPLKPRDFSHEFDELADGEPGPLDPARVLATARKWFIDTDFGRHNRETIAEVIRILGIQLGSRNAKPYRLKGAVDE